MKKLLFTLAAVATLSLGACQSSEQKAADEGAELKAKIENCNDPDSLAILVGQAKAYADKLMSEGKDSDAAAFLDEVTPTIDKKDPSLKEAFQNLGDAVKTAADSVGSSVKDAAENAKDAAGDALENAKEKGDAAVETAKEKGAAAVETAKEKGAAAVDNAKQKAADAINKGADKLKDAVK